MSYSRFHCSKAELRHAWLNLRDKHMTTGRINQVILLYGVNKPTIFGSDKCLNHLVYTFQ